MIEKINPLVIAGEETYRGKFPWHAAIYTSNVGNLKYICGGTLISRSAIISAGHCVAYSRSARRIKIANIVIYLGKHNLSKFNGPENAAKIANILIHPEYNPETLYSDIALITLQSYVEFTEYIRPVCLWSSNSDIRLVINQTGLIPGWGFDETGHVVEELSYARMPIVSHETCIWSNREVFSRVTSERSFCAGFRNGTSVCNGDSGSGLVISQNKQWYIRGIVSLSIALQKMGQLQCDPNHYVVFTDVAQFKDWIRNNM